MPRYEVIAPGYFNKVLHTPGHPRHGFVNTDKPLKPVPSWLKLTKAETAAQRKAREDKAAADAEQVADDKKEIDGVSFIGGEEAAGEPTGETVKTIG